MNSETVMLITIPASIVLLVGIRAYFNNKAETRRHEVRSRYHRPAAPPRVVYEDDEKKIRYVEIPILGRPEPIATHDLVWKEGYKRPKDGITYFKDDKGNRVYYDLNKHKFIEK